MKYFITFTLSTLLILTSLISNGQNFTVDNPNDASDNNPGDGICNVAVGGCTLRAAIEEASALAGPNIIDFALSSGTQITINTKLTITDDLTTVNGDIDGDGKPDIILVSGAVNIHGFDILSANNTIRGFNIIQFSGIGRAINIEGVGATGNTIISNYIGTNLAGDDATGTGNYRSLRIWLGATGNFIGNATIPGRNIISGNTFGLEINVSDNNQIAGNIIGLDVTGTIDLGNGDIGIEVISSTGTVIGLADTGGNFIAGNNQEGINISDSPNTTITNNYIGTNILGDAAVANGADGITISGTSSGSFIGSGISGEGNLISGNGNQGIEISSDGVSVLGNIIGLNNTGNAAIPNTSYGVWVSTGVAAANIGNGTADGRNIISGNNTHGILLSDGANIVQGNYIGLDINGTLNLGNNGIGIFVAGGTGSEIGGLLANQGNVIAGNAAGIEISAGSHTIYANIIGLNAAKNVVIANYEGIRLTANAQNNVVGGGILGANYISGNTQEGILLDGASVTSNIIQNNYIGIMGEGTMTPAGNGTSGVVISGDANFNSINNNIIANNGGSGIDVSGTITTQGNTFSQNSIYNNTTAGISIILGAQNNITPPIISSLLSDGTITGTSLANATIELFFDVVDQGQTYVQTTTADASGNWITTIPLTSFPNGQPNITATQTDGVNTSAFSTQLDISAVFDPLIVVNTNDSGAGSFRWTIENANTNTGTQTISFNIPTSDPNYDAVSGRWSIKPLSDLPSIIQTVTIDATTQPGTSNYRVIIDGQGTLANGLSIEAGSCEIYGLYITGFANGIDLAFTGGSAIIGAIGKGNTINNYGTNGITSLSGNHTIMGNLIGTDENGTLGLGGVRGINFPNNANNIIIGGINPGEGNVIAGNSADGLYFNNSGNHQIIGNYIGTDPTGLLAIPNDIGINIGTSGGTTVLNNIISANTTNGLIINTSSNCIVQGNKIGVGSDGTTALGNGRGIWFTTAGTADNNIIGGTAAGEANIIANSTGFGIEYNNANPALNPFIANQIFCNGDKGINLLGGNGGKTAPQITTYTTGSVSGTGIDGDVIHLYRDNTACAPLQGQEYLGTTIVAGGVWTINEGSILPTDLINATATDATNNTSEFAINFSEIMVFIGDPLSGQQIFNGQPTPADMGKGNEGIDLDRIFTIQNKSSTILNVTSVAVSLGSFSIVGVVPASVAPNSSETFLVRLSSVAQGIFTQTITVITDDADESTFVFDVTGEILPPLPTVVTVSPAANAIATAANANIDITFSENMDPASGTNATFIVTGEQSAVVPGSVSITSNTLSFIPGSPYKSGDLIRVTLTSGLRSLAGVALPPYTFEFRVASISGPKNPDFFFDETTTTISTLADGANTVFAIDVDGDGDMDVLASSEFANKISWYENDGAQGFAERIVSTTAMEAQHVYAADIDQDGDIDIISSSRVNGEIVWYENNGSQVFTERPIAFTGTTYAFYMALPRDVDGDGDVDIIAANRVEDKVAWYENDGLQNFTERVISVNANSIRSVYGIDVDGDGDMDVLSASVNDDKIAWYENDGAQNFTERIISLTANSARIVYATDMDNDGDVDVLSASFNDDKIAWYENDGAQNFTERVISRTADGARGMFAIDVDGDGDMDVMSASRRADKVVWYENDGSQVFTERLISYTTNSVRWVYATDIDGDGDIDALSASTNDDKIAWFENGAITPTVPLLNVVSVTPTENSVGIALNANISFTFDQAINGTTVTPANIGITGEQSGVINGTFSGLGTSVISFDPVSDFKAGEVIRITLTSGIQSTGSDPLLDEFIFEFRAITKDGPETPDLFSDDPATIISLTATDANVVFAADIDSDGDMDVLSSSQTANKIAWYQNDGNQGFTEFIVSTNALDIQHVFAIDLDQDGDMDLMSASRVDDKIAWYENDGLQNFTERVVSLNANGVYMAYAYDIDGDGDMDVLGAVRYDDKVAWYENDGAQNFTERIISLNANSVRSIYAIDVDGDGDMDVLSASTNDNKIAWYENDGYQNFLERTISTSALGARIVYAMDMDGDGDIDVISASYDDDKIAWYENDGSQQFTEHIISLTADGARSVYAADADGDGDIDVFSASRFADKVAWYENDGSQLFTEHVVTLTTNSVRGVYVSDVDGDGDVDILAASTNDNKIVWFKNTTLICSNPPTANANIDQTICDGNVANLNASIGGGATTISWSTAGDGSFDNLNSLTPIYTPGTNDITNGTVTLTIITDDPDGTDPCLPATDDIIITILPSPTANAGIDMALCEGEVANLSAVIGGSATTSTWSTNGDGSFDDLASLTAIYTPGVNDLTNGTATLTLTTNDPDGTGSCIAASDFLIINILQAPTADAGIAQTVCEGSDVNLVATIGGAATTITWTTSGNGIFADNTSLSTVYTPGSTDITNGTVTLTITTNDPDGTGSCIAATSQAVIAIEATPTADAGTDQSICPADVVALSGTIGGSATAATWSGSGDGSFDNPNSLAPSYTPGTADISNGTVTLTLTTTGSLACSPAIDAMLLDINQAISAIDQAGSVNVEESIIIDVTIGAGINVGDILTTTLLSTPQKGTATINTDGTITYTAAIGNVGVDSFNYQLSNQCNQTGSAQINITINNQPPTVNVPPSDVLSGGTVNINIIDNITDNNGNVDLSSLKIIVPPASGAIATLDTDGNLMVDYAGLTFTGIDELTIEICDFDGLCSQQVIYIEVAPPSVIIYNAISPNGDGKHDFLEIENAEFFPNNQVRILNRWGDIVYEVSGYDNLDIIFNGRANKGGSGELPAGTYFYSITLGDESAEINGFFDLRR